MKEKGVIPTLEIYHKLMEAYFFHGDVTGATGVLEEAKKVGLGTNS